MFLALKKIEVKQNKDSASKPDVGVSTLARHAAAFGECYRKQLQLLGGGGMSPANFFSEKALGASYRYAVVYVLL